MARCWAEPQHLERAIKYDRICTGRSGLLDSNGPDRGSTVGTYQLSHIQSQPPVADPRCTIVTYVFIMCKHVCIAA
jgi:hypothetical protein